MLDRCNTMQSPLVVWTPSKSSSRVELIHDDLSTNDHFVTRRLLVPSDEEGSTEASSDDLELELAAMQTCYGQLKQLVPTVPVNGELSRLQLLQHVIDYIIDLELALHSSASMSSSPQRHQYQQPETSACRSRTTTTHTNDQQSLSTISSADERLTAYCDNCSTSEIAQTLPQSILNESTA